MSSLPGTSTGEGALKVQENLESTQDETETVFLGNRTKDLPACTVALPDVVCQGGKGLHVCHSLHWTSSDLHAESQ